MEDQNYHQSIQNQQQLLPQQILQWQLHPYQDQEQVWHHQDQENHQYLQPFQCQQPQQDQGHLQHQQPQYDQEQKQPQQDQEQHWQQQPQQDPEQQWHQQDPDQKHLSFHWQQQPQKDHPEQLRLQRELDHDHGYQQHIEDDFRESYGQITDTELIQEQHDQQLAVAFNRGQELHSQKLTLAFIQEEEDLKLAVALIQEDQDRNLAVALTQEEQDRLLALSLIEKITKPPQLQDQKLLLTSNNEFETRTPYQTNRQDLLKVNVDHKSQQNNQYYMGVQDTVCLSSSYTQDFGPISEIVQQVVDWLTGRSQQISDRFSAMPPRVIRERNNDKKETNIEDFLGKFSKTSKEVKCWFSVELPIEKSNIAGTETKGQFCGGKSKIIDPASIHPSQIHRLPIYENPDLIKDDSKMHLNFNNRKSPIPSAPPLEVPLTYETVPSASTKDIYQDDRRSSNQIYDFEHGLQTHDG